MKELDINIGQLFDFMEYKFNANFKYDEFVDSPFVIKFKDENDNWVNCSKFIKKQDSLYEVRMDNGKTLKAGGSHILSIYPDKDLHKYVKDLQVGDEIPYMNSKVESIRMLKDNGCVFSPVIDSASHLYKDSNGFIHHNTHTVEKAVDEGLELWKENPKHSTKPEKLMYSGSIGKSFTPILIFFYKNRHNKLLILDDADGFLLNPDQDIQNFLKGILNSTLKGVTTPASIRNRATKTMQDEAEMNAKASGLKESLIKVNTSKLHEGKCSVSVNGGREFGFSVSRDEALELGNTFGFKPLKEKKYRKTVWSGTEGRELKLNFMQEAEESEPAMTAEEAKFMNDLANIRAQADFKKADMGEFINEVDSIPETWVFDSNVILISNLSIDDLDEAVISRCDKYELRINTPEFVAHSEQILPGLKMGIYSSNAPDVIEWCKRESFAIFKSVVLNATKFKNFNIPIEAHLDFRLLGNIANRMILNVNEYCNENHLDPRDESVRPEIEMAIKDDFIADLLELLATGGKKKK